MSNKQKIGKPEIIRVFRNGVQARLTLLHHLIDLHIADQDLELPKKVSAKLKDELITAGGPKDWMMLQSGFNQIVKKKRFQISFKEALRKYRDERYGEGRNIVSTDQATPLPERQKASISPVITEEKIIVARLSTLKRLLKKAVDPTLTLGIPKDTPFFIVEEIQAAPSIADWMKSHPDFDFQYQRMLKKPTASPDYKKFYISTKTLSKEEVITLGYKRITVHDPETPFDQLLELVIAVGSLPSPPKLIDSKDKQQNAINGQLVYAWKSRMTDLQSKIWNTMPAEVRSTYLVEGKISVGTRILPKKSERVKPSPIGDVPKDYIERMIEKTSSSDFDLTKIDWDAT